MSVKSTDDLKTRQLERFERHYRSWACGEGIWPQRVTLGRPSSEALAGTLRPIKDWIADWQTWDSAGTVEWTPRRTVLGAVSCPSAITFERPDDIAALSQATDTTWRAARSFLTRLEAEWQGAAERAKPILARVVEMDLADQNRLIDVCGWLHANPASGMFLRQVPVAGINTKWIENHRGLVGAMLTLTSPPLAHLTAAAADQEDVVGDFHERLGLLRTPRHINVILCDDALRSDYGGARTLGLTGDDLAATPTIPQTLLVIENKETGYAVPDRDGLMVVHGLGLNLKALAEIAWLQKARVLYWGDIDGAGFEWLNSLRGYGVAVTSVLMSESVNSLSPSYPPQPPNFPSSTFNKGVAYNKNLR